jgi:hypothetical protein
MQTIENETVLFDLPDSVLDRCDGPIWEVMRAAGYDGSPRVVINHWDCWGLTVGEFLEQLRATSESAQGISLWLQTGGAR